jgi:hypothetical protein
MTMQKLTPVFFGFLMVSSFALQALADDPFLDTPKIRAATKVMLQNCKKEFPEEVPGMSINSVDHWAEAQERAATEISTPFEKTKCFATHETWEKLVQRNEWAANETTDSTRQPASAGTATTTGQKFIDGNKVPTWDGPTPIF